MKPILTQVIDIGDQVICDFCSKEWTPDMLEQGGLLFQSKAVCPDCAPELRADVAKNGGGRFIKAEQPTFSTFHAWVMALRGGDNTMKVYTYPKGDA